MGVWRNGCRKLTSVLPKSFYQSAIFVEVHGVSEPPILIYLAAGLNMENTCTLCFICMYCYFILKEKTSPFPELRNDTRL